MNSDQTEIGVVRFEPGALLEIDDPMSGRRRLALVTDSGVEFVEYVDSENPPTPHAILDDLSPVQWGDYRAISTDLMLAGEVDRYLALADFVLELCATPAAKDVLTFNRAVKWAFETGELNAAKAAVAGVAATIDARARPGGSIVLH